MSRRPKQPPPYFQVSKWEGFPKIYLVLAIRKLAFEEHLARGPMRARLRTKRLRAVELFRRRFGEVPALKEYGLRRLPWD